jgi:hypothetical protein
MLQVGATGIEEEELNFSSTKGGKFLDWLRDSELLKYAAPWR